MIVKIYVGLVNKQATTVDSCLDVILMCGNAEREIEVLELDVDLNKAKLYDTISEDEYRERQKLKRRQ